MEGENKRRHSNQKHSTYNVNKSYGVQLNLGEVVKMAMNGYNTRQAPENKLISFDTHSSQSLSSSSDNGDYYEEFLRNIINERKKSRSQKIDNPKKPMVDHQLHIRRPRGKSDAINDFKRIARKKNSAVINLAPINEEKKDSDRLIKMKRKPKRNMKQCLTVNKETSFSIYETKHDKAVEAYKKEAKEDFFALNINTNTNSNGDTVANTHDNVLLSSIAIKDNMLLQGNKKGIAPMKIEFNPKNISKSSFVNLFPIDKKNGRHKSFCMNHDPQSNAPEDEAINCNKKIITISPGRAPKFQDKPPKNKLTDIVKETPVLHFNNNYNSNKKSSSSHKKKSDNDSLNAKDKQVSEFLPRELFNLNSSLPQRDQPKEKIKDIAPEPKLKSKKTVHGPKKGNNKEANDNKPNSNDPLETQPKEGETKPKKRTNIFSCCIPIG